MTVSSDDSDGSAVATPSTLIGRLYLCWVTLDRGWKATVIGLIALCAVLVQP
jgi:hypothetical protein